MYPEIKKLSESAPKEVVEEWAKAINMHRPFLVEFGNEYYPLVDSCGWGFVMIYNFETGSRPEEAIVFGYYADTKKWYCAFGMGDFVDSPEFDTPQEAYADMASKHEGYVEAIKLVN